mgnify:CR=1 FL=1
MKSVWHVNVGKCHSSQTVQTNQEICRALETGTFHDKQSFEPLYLSAWLMYRSRSLHLKMNVELYFGIDTKYISREAKIPERETQ